MVGGLGTLTLNVMAMTHLLKGRNVPARARLPVWGTLLIAAATLARVAGGLGLGEYRALLFAGSLCWSVAFALLLWLFVREREGRCRNDSSGH